MEMELDFLWFIVAALLGCYVFIFWFLKRVNEWYYHYVAMVGETTSRLPTGDMGWPLFGNMLSLFKTLRSAHPNSFIYNQLVSRYGKTGIYKAHMFGGPSIIVCTPEICRRVLTNDEHFTNGYPKSATLLSGRTSLHTVSNVEHRRLLPVVLPRLVQFKVIDEMLRMTTMFSLFREAKVDVSINGYIIPKGWKVLVWYGAVHTDSEIYDNPQNFDPSRWNRLSFHLVRAADFVLEVIWLNYKMKRLNPGSPLSRLQGPMPKDQCLAQVISIPSTNT